MSSVFALLEFLMYYSIVFWVVREPCSLIAKYHYAGERGGMAILKNIWDALTGILASSPGSATAAPPLLDAKAEGDRWLYDLPSDAVRRSIMAALSREAVAGVSNTPYDTRHQLGISMGYRPVKAAVPAAVVRRDAFFTDPWWHRSEARKSVPDMTAVSADSYRTLPDGSLVISEDRYPFELLDGRRVVQVRRVLVTPQGQRRKEFSLHELGSDEQEGKSLSLADVAAVLPLIGLTGIDPKHEKMIVVAEGAVAVEALRRHGLAACGTLTGALHTPPHAALAPLAAFRTIFLWPDNDTIGVRHMERIAHRLSSLGAKDVRVVRWAGGPRKGDAADFREGEAGIRDLLDKAQVWKPVNRVRNRGYLAINMPNAPGSLTLPLGLRPAHLSVEPFARKPVAFRSTAMGMDGEDSGDSGETIDGPNSPTEPKHGG